MKKILVIIGLFVSVSTQAEIMGFNELVVDFTNSTAAITNVNWSEPDKISVATNGLGWDGETNASRDFWIQSIPVAIGTSWRPAGGASLTVDIYPQTRPVISDNGNTRTVDDGSVFVRYSPDKKHWSSWQALEVQMDDITNRNFHGQIQVARIEREKYGELVSQYSHMDVPWSSDEEAAVKWILQKEPDFFAKQLPFVGYVQFRMEGSLHGSQRIKHIKMQLSWLVGGMHIAPKNPDDYKTHQGPWRFEAQ